MQHTDEEIEVFDDSISSVIDRWKTNDTILASNFDAKVGIICKRNKRG